MESFLLVVHVIIALAIVGLIMLQQGKGAEMGASFGGGGSQTVFGAAGSGNFFSRLTGILVAVFFASSVFLAILSKENSSVETVDVPVLETVQEATNDIPVDSSATPSDEMPEVPAESLVEEATDEVPTE